MPWLVACRSARAPKHQMRRRIASGLVMANGEADIHLCIYLQSLPAAADGLQAWVSA